MPDLKEKIVETAVEKVNAVIAKNIYRSKFQDKFILATSREELKQEITDALRKAFEEANKENKRGQ